MGAVINLIVTCTKDKRMTVTDDCQLRNVRSIGLSPRVRDWCSRLSNEKSRVPVRDLYSGDHWAVAREIRSSRFTVNTYVCSAGYGLIGIDDFIVPYAATFSRKHPDSIWSQDENAITSCEWWKKICGWKGLPGFGSRSITELAAEQPKTPMMVVASENYLKAIKEDLEKARDSLASTDLMMIVSTGTRQLGELSENLIPCDARLQSAVGGIRRSLNVRVARKLISDARSLPTLESLSSKMKRLLASQPDLPVYDRQSATDEEVRSFILSYIRVNKNAAHTHLLRTFRSDGFACEQKRFSKLFQEVKERVNG